MHIIVNFHLRRLPIQLPYMIRSAGYYTPHLGFQENNDGTERQHCGLFWCQQGQADFTLNGKAFRMTPGDFLSYEPHAAHAIQVHVPDFQYYWLTFDGPLAKQFLRAFQFPDTPIQVGPPPVELWDKAFKTFNDAAPDTVFTSLEIVSQILARAAAGMHRPATGTTQQDAFVKFFQKVVKENCHNPEFNLNTAANLMHCHRTTLLRNIRRHLKCLPGSIIQSARLNRAMQLLANPQDSIADISRKSGFASQAYFAKLFRKLTGMTPSDFRKNAT